MRRPAPAAPPRCRSGKALDCLRRATHVLSTVPPDSENDIDPVVFSHAQLVRVLACPPASRTCTDADAGQAPALRCARPLGQAPRQSPMAPLSSSRALRPAVAAVGARGRIQVGGLHQQHLG